MDAIKKLKDQKELEKLMTENEYTTPSQKVIYRRFLDKLPNILTNIETENDHD